MMRTRSLRARERAALIATSASAWMFAVASSHASLAANFRALPISSADEVDSRRMLRDVRNAELTGDLAKLASLREAASASTSNDASARAASALLLERIVLAERAIAMRNRTQSARELAQGEEALASERLALATRFATVERRQLELESAEDLLLRRMRADLMDVALALGVPTDDEREAARRLSKLIAPIFATSRAEDSALDASRIATDPEIFREAMLGGIASLLAAARRFHAPQFMAMWLPWVPWGPLARTHAPPPSLSAGACLRTPGNPCARIRYSTYAFAT
jgi:hypothetical protein